MGTGEGKTKGNRQAVLNEQTTHWQGDTHAGGVITKRTGKEESLNWHGSQESTLLTDAIVPRLLVL